MLRHIQRLSLLTILFLFIGPLYSQDFSIDKTGGLQIEKINPKEYILTFKATVQNVSGKGVGVTIKKGKLFKDEEYMGTVQLLKKLKIKNSRNQNLDIQLKVILEKELDLAGHGLQLLLGKSLNLKLNGLYKVTWLIFGKKFPFEYQEKISLNSLMGK
jgi:hypothetical protein